MAVKLTVLSNGSLRIEGEDIEMGSGISKDQQDRVFGFLGVEPLQVESIPSDNSRVFVRDGARTRAFGTPSTGPPRSAGNGPKRRWLSMAMTS